MQIKFQSFDLTAHSVLTSVVSKTFSFNINNNNSFLCRCGDGYREDFIQIMLFSPDFLSMCKNNPIDYNSDDLYCYYYMTQYCFYNS